MTPGGVYLVGSFIASEKYQSIGMTIPNIWKNQNVPNHQPDMNLEHLTVLAQSFRKNKASHRTEMCSSPPTEVTARVGTDFTYMMIMSCIII